MRSTYLLFGISCALLASLASTSYAITINITYDDAMALTESSGVFNATEKAVISQAVTQWQTAITTPGIVNITVVKSALGGNLLGFATQYATGAGDSDADGRLNGTPISGLVQIDDRVGDANQFFVDNTPAQHEEFAPGNTNYHFINGPAQQYDMLTTVKHEICHVLGFSQSFDNFFDGLVQSPIAAEQLRWLYVFGGPPAVGPPAQYKPDPNQQFGGFPNGGVYMREWEEVISGPGPVPSHVDEFTGVGMMAPPASGVGSIAGFFDDDLMNPTQALGERKIESDVDLDILADAYGYTVVPEPTVLGLLGLGVLGIMRRKRR